MRLAVALVGLVLVGCTASEPAPIAPQPVRLLDKRLCPVTAPAGYTNGALSVISPGADGLILAGAGSIEPDGAIRVKLHWTRNAPGSLRITGHRTDATRPALRADVPEGYGESGFQASHVFLPTEGCWEIAGQLGESRLTFVAFVIKQSSVRLNGFRAPRPRESVINMTGGPPCVVTLRNASTGPDADGFGYDIANGTGTLWVGGLGREGVLGVPGPDDEPKGYTGEKFGWWRGEPGRLVITGRKLDGPAPPLRADIPDGYTEIGFQASAIAFPTEGCWEVTGKVGGNVLTFVTLVIRR